MYITLDPPCRQGFLAALSRQASPSFSLLLQGERLELLDVGPAQAGRALAEGAFPVYESGLLRSLLWRHFAGFGPSEQAELLAVARTLAGCDLYRGTPASGPGRLRRLGGLLTAELERGGLDFRGFCRFRLPGHGSYLRFLLETAVGELIAAQEDAEYGRLLQETALPGPESGDWTLEFFAGGAFTLCGGGREEGGRWPGREDALIADLIARRPRSLRLRGLAYAPLSLTACLEQALGERLEYPAADP